MTAAVARGAERIRSLARRLLAFSRPEREEMVPLAVNDVVERSLELCLYQIAGRLKLEKRLAPTLPRVLGVSDQLEMALINLVVNAVHAMRERGGTLTVGTRLMGGGDVEVSVSDEGPGIPEDVRASISTRSSRPSPRARAPASVSRPC